jgi:hypothetical protein
MSLIWELLSKIKQSEHIGIHNAFVIIRETEYGEEKELTDLGIRHYFNSFKKGVDYSIVSIRESANSYYVTAKISKKNTNILSFGTTLQNKNTRHNSQLLLADALKGAFINAMRNMIGQNEEKALINRYIALKKSVRIPIATDKIKIFKTNRDCGFINRAS